MTTTIDVPSTTRSRDRLFQKSLRYALPSVRPHLAAEREQWAGYIFDHIDDFINNRSSIGISCACIFMRALLRGGYGLKREQYIRFLDLVLPLIFVPEIPASPASEWMKTCTFVLRVVTLEDIPYTIEWRPIFEYAKSLTFTPQRSARPYLPDGYATDFISFVSAARRFFPGSVQEAIMAEVRPHLHPFDTKAPVYFALALQFLPTRPNVHFPIDAPLPVLEEVVGLLQWGEGYLAPALGYLARLIDARAGYVKIPDAALDCVAGEVAGILKLPITPTAAAGGDMLSQELLQMVANAMGDVVEQPPQSASAAQILMYSLVDPSVDGGASVGRLRRVVTSLLPFVQVSAEGRSESAVQFVSLLARFLRDRLRAQSPAAMWVDVDAVNVATAAAAASASKRGVRDMDDDDAEENARALAMRAHVAARADQYLTVADDAPCRKTAARPHVPFPSSARISPETIDYICITLMQAITPALQHSQHVCTAFATVATLCPDAAYGHDFEQNLTHALRALDRPLMAMRLMACVAVGFCSLVCPCRAPGKACTAVVGRAPSSVDDLCRVLRRRGCALRIINAALPALLSTITAHDVQRMDEACLTAISVLVSVPVARLGDDAPPAGAEVHYDSAAAAEYDHAAATTAAKASVDTMVSALFGDGASAVRAAAEASGPLFAADSGDPTDLGNDAPLLSELPDPAFGIGQRVVDPAALALGVTASTPLPPARALLIGDGAWRKTTDDGTVATVGDLANHVRKASRDVARLLPSWAAQFVSRVLHTSRFLGTATASNEVIYAVTAAVGSAALSTQVEIMRDAARSVAEEAAIEEGTGKPLKGFFRLLGAIAAVAPTLAATHLLIPIFERILRHQGDAAARDAEESADGAILGLAPLDAVHLFSAATAVAGATPLVLAACPPGMREVVVGIVERALSRRNIVALGGTDSSAAGLALRAVSLFVRDITKILPLPCVLDAVKPVPALVKASPPPTQCTATRALATVTSPTSPSSPPGACECPAEMPFAAEAGGVMDAEGAAADDDDEADDEAGGEDPSLPPAPLTGTFAPRVPPGEGVFVPRGLTQVLCAEPTRDAVDLAVRIFNGAVIGAISIVADSVAAGTAAVDAVTAAASEAAVDALVYPSPSSLAGPTELGDALRARIAAAGVASEPAELPKGVARAALRVTRWCCAGVARTLLPRLPHASYESEPSLRKIGLPPGALQLRTGAPWERFSDATNGIIVSSGDIAELFTTIVHAHQRLVAAERSDETAFSPQGGGAAAIHATRLVSDADLLESWVELVEDVVDADDVVPITSSGIRIELSPFGCVHRAYARLPQACKIIETMVLRGGRWLDYLGGTLTHRTLLAMEALALGVSEGVAAGARTVHSALVRALHYADARLVSVRLVERFDRGVLRTQFPLDGSLIGREVSTDPLPAYLTGAPVAAAGGKVAAKDATAAGGDAVVSPSSSRGKHAILDEPLGPPHRENDIVGITTLIEQNEATMLINGDLLVRFIVACAAMPMTPLLNDLEKADGPQARTSAEAAVAATLDTLASSHVARPVQIASAQAAPLGDPIHAPARAILYRGGHVLGQLISDAVTSKTISFDSVETMLRATRFFVRLPWGQKTPPVAVARALLRSLFDVLSVTHNDSAIQWVIRVLFSYTPRASHLSVPRGDVLKGLRPNIDLNLKWLPDRPFPLPFKSLADARIADVAASAGDVVDVPHALDSFADGYYSLPEMVSLKDRAVPLESRVPSVFPDPDGVALSGVDVLQSLRQLVRDLECLLPLGEQMALRWALDGDRDEAALATTYADFWRSIARVVGPPCVPFFAAIAERLLREVQVARGGAADSASASATGSGLCGASGGPRSAAGESMDESVKGMMSAQSHDAESRVAVDVRSARSVRSARAALAAPSPTGARPGPASAKGAPPGLRAGFEYDNSSDDDDGDHASAAPRRTAGTATGAGGAYSPDAATAPVSFRGTLRGAVAAAALTSSSPVSPHPLRGAAVGVRRQIRATDTMSHTSSNAGRSSFTANRATGAAAAGAGASAAPASEADSDTSSDDLGDDVEMTNAAGEPVAAGLGDEAGYVSVLMEVLGGLVRAALLWDSLDAQRAAWEVALDVLDTLLTPSLPQNMFICVTEFIGYVSDDMDPRRLRPLRRFTFALAARACHDALLDDPRASALVVSRALMVFKSNADMASRGSSCCEALSLGVLPLLAHRFEAVRSSAVQVMALAVCDQQVTIRSDRGLARPLGLDEVAPLQPLVVSIFAQLALGVAVADAVVRGVAIGALSNDPAVAAKEEAAAAALRSVSADDALVAGLVPDSPYRPPVDASTAAGWALLVKTDDDAARLCEAVVDFAKELSQILSGPTSAIASAFSLLVAAISVQPKHTSDKLANALPTLTILANYSQSAAASRALAHVVVETISGWIDPPARADGKAADGIVSPTAAVASLIMSPEAAGAPRRHHGSLDRWRSRVVVFSFLPILLYKHAAALLPPPPIDEPLRHEAAPLRKLRNRKRPRPDESNEAVVAVEPFDAAAVAKWPGVRLISLCVDVLQSAVPELREVAMSVLSLATLSLPKAMVSALLSRFDAQRTTVIPDNKSFSRVRHAGVLGVAGMLGAFVDDVPPLVPTLLERLAAHADDHPTTATVVKDAFTTSVSLWWATHRDFWSYIRVQFTEEQQETIYALNYSPAFYA